MTSIEHAYLFRDLDNPNRFYRVTASDSELATLRAFSKFGHRITALLAEEMLAIRTQSGQAVEVVEWN